MKSNLLIILACMMLTCGASGQAVPPIPAPDKDPFVGKWQANRDKSQPKLDARDASYVRTVTREGDNLMFSSRIDNPRGIQNHYKIRCDGQFHPVPFGSILCEYKAPNLVEGETKLRHLYTCLIPACLLRLEVRSPVTPLGVRDEPSSVPQRGMADYAP